MEWVRSHYGVPAKRGGRVEFPDGYTMITSRNAIRKRQGGGE